MSKQRAKGTAWETAVLRWLHSLGYHDAYRTGSADYGHGDVVIPSLQIAIECKSVARIDHSDILKQCQGIHARNPHLVAVVACIKKRGSTSPTDAYWLSDGPNFYGLATGVRHDFDA